MRTSYSMAIPRPRMYINGGMRAYVYNARARVGTATEIKFDCREAKGLFYTLQTNRMRNAKRHCVRAAFSFLSHGPEVQVRGVCCPAAEGSVNL